MIYEIIDTSPESAPYLSDAYGRVITPVISPPPPQQSTNDMSHVPRVGRPPKDGVTKAERDVAHELKSLEEHKRAVGAVMDRTGCVLASEGRRGTFLDGEDFEDVGFGGELDG